MNSTMLKGLLIFVAVAALWLALLWFGLAPDFSAWSNLALLAVHALPPLAVWLGWWLLRRRALTKQAAEVEQRERQARAERESALAAARDKHQNELRQRQFSCDCRVVTIAELAVKGEAPVTPEEMPAVVVETQHEAPRAEPCDVLERLQPALENSLRNLYATCGAAAVFPVYVLPPAEASGEEVVRRVRAAHALLMHELALPVERAAEQPGVLFLPAADGAANSVLALFETAPDLPGAVVLAFDSARSRVPATDEFFDEPDPERVRLEKQIGQPSEGVFALLVTHAALPSMLEAMAGTPEDPGRNFPERDSLTPYWHRAMQPGGNLALLTRVGTDLRNELAALPVLARIHRAAFIQTEGKQSRVLELTRAMQSLLERAQINAGLIEQPFSFDGANPEAVAENSTEPKCGWLVHNAGGVDYAGTRLAALGSALMYFDIDLNPIDMATNVVTRIGDLGRACPIGMLAITIAQAAAHKLPALCSEFYGQDGIALSFAMPAKQG